MRVRKGDRDLGIVNVGLGYCFGYGFGIGFK